MILRALFFDNSEDFGQKGILGQAPREQGREQGKIVERASMIRQAHKAGLTKMAIAEMFQLPEVEVNKVLTVKLGEKG